ncbi:hypothetical protein [Caballeronia sp. AZ7_KS35]|uniref:hypothetical protein n=1 Tax=Caballeronia sp. AZ7_KS35 TaxID=2921762 RepID=UPI0020289136|nr:hypothetical protein [Caballeronia sp. AZ7_KS35]
MSGDFLGDLKGKLQSVFAPLAGEPAFAPPDENPVSFLGTDPVGSERFNHGKMQLARDLVDASQKYGPNVRGEIVDRSTDGPLASTKNEFRIVDARKPAYDKALEGQGSGKIIETMSLESAKKAVDAENWSNDHQKIFEPMKPGYYNSPHS